MTTFMTGFVSTAFVNTSLALIIPKFVNIVPAALWSTGFLCVLNVALALIFRKRHKREVLSYCIACSVELAIFAFALLFYFGVIAQVPYHLPPGLPFNRAQIGAALAIGVGLFPAAYWHRVNLADLPGRIARDGKVMKQRNASVHVPPGEWMN